MPPVYTPLRAAVPRRRNRQRARALVLAAAAALLAAGGCRREADGAAGMSDSTFVTTMVELRRLDSALTADSAARAAMRGAVLRRRGITVADLERAAAALANDPEHALRVFSRIDSIVAKRDTTPPVVPANAPPRATTPARPGAAQPVAPRPGTRPATPPRPRSGAAPRGSSRPNTPPQ